MLAKASALVSPSLMHPGNSGTVTVYPPDSLGSRITRNFLDIIPSSPIQKSLAPAKPPLCPNYSTKVVRKGNLPSHLSFSMYDSANISVFVVSRAMPSSACSTACKVCSIKLCAVSRNFLFVQLLRGRPVNDQIVSLR